MMITEELQRIVCDTKSLRKKKPFIEKSTVPKELESLYIPKKAVYAVQPSNLHNQPTSPLSISKLLSHPNVLVPVVLLTVLLILSLVITAGVCGYIR